MTALGVVIGGSAAWWVFPSVARAATCGQDVKYNVEATDGEGFAHDGVRVASPGMYIYNYTAYCRQASSVASVATTGDLAEVGWIDIATGESNCNTTGDNSPRVMTVWVKMGAYHCFVHGYLAVNQSDAFSVWGNSSDVWTWTHAGHNAQTQTLDFRTSLSITNGERHSSYDSAESLFNGMQNGADGNWHNWTDSVCYVDSDPSYNTQLHSSTDISVSQGSQQC